MSGKDSAKESANDDSSPAKMATGVDGLDDILEGGLPDSHLLTSERASRLEAGFGFIRKVRALPPERGGKIPAVALTAYARAEDRLRVLRSGYQMHVAKPVELNELVAIVASVVGRK